MAQGGAFFLDSTAAGLHQTQPSPQLFQPSFCAASHFCSEINLIRERMRGFGYYHTLSLARVWSLVASRVAQNKLTPAHCSSSSDHAVQPHRIHLVRNRVQEYQLHESLPKTRYISLVATPQSRGRSFTNRPNDTLLLQLPVFSNNHQICHTSSN